MCGIFSIFSSTGPVDPGRVAAAVAALDHRGPDTRRTLLLEDDRVALGHARLSIIDLTGGDQPIANETGDIHAIVNGELYDFERLRDELVAGGHRFRTASDSEILLHLYEDRGTACVEALRGEFAFVLWDSRNQVLFAARDRFGTKPLCYAFHDGALYIASEAKALFAAGVPAAWDEESVHHCLSTQYLLPDRTLFRGVRQLEPAHVLVATRAAMKTTRYWDLDFPAGAERSTMGEAEAIAGLRDRLDEAVRLRLRADVPVGCYLSGGLDSCAVLALASRHRPGAIPCFTVSFEHPTYDELPIAREMAARVGAPLHEVRVGARELVDSFAASVIHAEILAVNGHGGAKLLLSRAVRQHGIKVVLTGEGSDEIFAGYAHFRRDLARSATGAAPHELEAALQRLAEQNPVSAGILLPQGEGLPTEHVRRRLGYVPGFLEAKATLGKRCRDLLDADFGRRFQDRDSFRLVLDATASPSAFRGRHPLHQSMLLWARLGLANYLLRLLGDGVEMANSVEGRLPFLDHVVVEWAQRLPIDLLIRGTVEKYVLREAMKPLIVDRVHRRQKHPFLAPPEAPGEATGGFHDMLKDTLGSAGAVPFFDRRRLRRLLDDLPARSAEERTAADPVLMLALSAAVLKERFRL